MKWNKFDFYISIMILIPIVMIMTLYNKLPNELAIHFGTSGEPNGYQGKLFFLLTNFLLLIGIPLLMKVTRYIDPKKRNYDKFESTYEIFRLIFSAFLSVMTITLLFYNLGHSVNIQMIVLIGIGILFMFLGKYMSRIQFNYTMGIRTPWTLANEEVWRRTHQLGGPLWLIGGIIIIILAFLPGKIAFIFMMIMIAIITIIPVLYSYFLFKKLGG